MRDRALQSLLFVVFTWQLVACVEALDASYSTFPEAQSKGAVVAGWVPEWLPPAATGIREVHNIDTNRFMLAFYVPTGTQLSLPAGCAPVAPRAPNGPPFKRAWWPSDVPADGVSTHRHSFFACPSYFVAHSSSLGEGYVWSAD
jgi:hypothetical protein